MKLLGRQQPDTELEVQQVRAGLCAARAGRGASGGGTRALPGATPGPLTPRVGRDPAAGSRPFWAGGVATRSVEIMRFPQVVLGENRSAETSRQVP